MNSHKLVNDDFYTPEIVRALKEFRNSFIGQAVLERIDFQLDKLLRRFDNTRITQTYEERTSSIQGGRRELIQFKNWMLQQ
jgi:hypothetical protein